MTSRAGLLCVALLAGGAVLSAQAVDVRVVDEQAPPGGTAIVILELTEPKPISSGQLRFAYDLGPLGDINEAVALDLQQLQSQVTVASGEALVSFSSPQATFGNSPDLPIIVLAIPVSPAATAGQTASITVDLSQSTFLDPQGIPYTQGVKPGTFTVGGFSITDMTPAEGMVSAGQTIVFDGVGFEPGMDVNIQEANVGAVQFVSAQQLKVTLASPFEIKPTTRLRLRTNDHEEIAYPALFVDAVGPPPPSDGDGDGVDDAVEDGAPNGGDGNSDGIADRTQPHVASLPDAASGAWATLEAQDGPPVAFRNVKAVANPAPGSGPAGVLFPLAFFDFQVTGLAPGGAVSVSIRSENPFAAEDFYKYGPTPANPQPHWYRFRFDGTVGASRDGARLVARFVDGAAGDGDLAANGEITDPGGPAYILPRVVFPQYVDGDGNRSRVIVRNTGTVPADVQLRFRAFDSGLEMPSGVTVGGIPAADSEESIPSFGVIDLETDGTGPLETGVVEVVVDPQSAGDVGGSLVYSVLGDFVSVPGSAARSEHQLFVSRSAAENTGVALYNPHPTLSSRVLLVLLDRQGSSGNVVETVQIVLPPASQRVGFIDEPVFFPGFFAGRPEFQGTLNVTVVEGPDIAVLGLLQKFLTGPGGEPRAPLIALSPGENAFRP